jgi:hypothetical protein
MFGSSRNFLPPPLVKDMKVKGLRVTSKRTNRHAPRYHSCQWFKRHRIWENKGDEVFNDMVASVQKGITWHRMCGNNYHTGNTGQSTSSNTEWVKYNLLAFHSCMLLQASPINLQ